MNIIKNSESKRLLGKPMLLIGLCILIGILLQLWNVYLDLNMTFDVAKGSLEEHLTQNSVNELKQMADGYHNSYIVWRDALSGYELVIILLACIPFSASYVIDKKTGFINNVLLRTNSRKYILSKAIFNSIIGGLIVIIPSTIILIVSSMFLNNSVPKLSIYYPTGFFKSYFFSNINLYVLFYTTILFIIGMTYSTLSMAIGMLTENIILCLLCPSIFWYVGSILFESLGLNILAPWNIYYFNVEPSISFEYSLILTLLIFTVSNIYIYVKSKMEKI
ncbi:hypothetical protein [Paraclostridium sordellii]|uniref:hypothetical protein n=1 Tax=Paraclostridium sordellii TaxID=1505 RepID=UPI001896E3DB|nr:hypothetical protein [Paeniclostridium sordellii]